MSLDGKVALITGTACGQGLAAAQLFAEAGATVVGCDIKPTDGSDPVDLTDEGAARRWVDAAADDYGGIDILYANAGATRFSPLEETTAEELLVDGGWSAVLPDEWDGLDEFDRRRPAARSGGRTSSRSPGLTRACLMVAWPAARRPARTVAALTSTRRADARLRSSALPPHAPDAARDGRQPSDRP